MFLHFLLKMTLEKLAECEEEYLNQRILYPMMWSGKTGVYLPLAVRDPAFHRFLKDGHRKLFLLSQTVKRDWKIE